MLYEISKEKLHNIEEFIKEAAFNKHLVEKKIKSGRYTEFDIAKLNAMEFYMLGMFIMLSVFRLKHSVKRYEYPMEITIKNVNREIDFDAVTKRCETTLERLRTLQAKHMNMLDEIDDDNASDVDINIEKEIKSIMMLNIIYGMQIVANLLDMSLNAKVDAQEVLTFTNSSINNENLENTRRRLGRVLQILERRINAFNKAQIDEVRKIILEMRMSRLSYVTEINSSSVGLFDDRQRYLSRRMNVFDEDIDDLKKVLRETKIQMEIERKDLNQIYVRMEEE